ncbi:hypothetical protein EDB85DRAFT_2276458 [Lactarius pseudohatsudake]|nr:hypothetical protein EDB85DRAFT_2276458 [Lactarius pseudohatsudake]
MYGVYLGARTSHEPLTPTSTLISVYSAYFQDMEHRQIISNSPAGSTASRPSRISTQVAGSQGSRLQPEGTERVEVTVIRARDVPQFGSILGVKTESTSSL